MDHLEQKAIAENRDLSRSETDMVTWLLEHGTDLGKQYLGQIPSLKVISRCPCGCASVNFRDAGAVAQQSGGMLILADFAWTSSTGDEFGIFVFARSGALSGLEVWSVDGSATPTELLSIADLRPMEFSNK